MFMERCFLIRIISIILVFILLCNSFLLFYQNSNYKRISSVNYEIIDNKEIFEFDKEFDELVLQVAEDIVENKYSNVDVSWSFNKARFLIGLGEDMASSNIEAAISSSIIFSFVQYSLIIEKTNDTIYFSRKEDMSNYKEKLVYSSVEFEEAIKKYEELKITDSKELENRVIELNNLKIAEEAEIREKEIREAEEREARKVATTSRGYVSRSTDDMSGIVPLESYIYISSNFRTYNRPDHTGVDYAAKQGTPILAFQSGVVVMSKWNGNYGYMVAIDHQNGMVTRYAHCSQLNVSTGNVVSQGDIIALVGSTGNSTGAHLHFEVIIDNVFYNPLDYVL